MPLCTVEIALTEPIIFGHGPSGLRAVGPVTSGTVRGDRLSGTLSPQAGADWLTINDNVMSVDVRLTIVTDGGARIFVQYQGRSDVTNGPGSTPVYVAPRFETGHPDYTWLNLVQAVGKGAISAGGSAITYEWYEAR